MSNDISTTKPPFWRDVKTLAWIFQFAVLGAAVAIVGILINNLRVNSANRGIPTDFGFLDQPSGFPIPGSDFRQTQPVREAIGIGATNTLRVAVIGIILSTIFGVLIGVGRLSGNWLIRNAARSFVEAIRNVPLLGIVIFAYLAMVISALPSVEESWKVDGLVIMNGRGTSVPWYTGSGLKLLAVLVIAGLVALGIRRWRLHVADDRGEPARTLMWSLPAFALLAFWGAVAVGTGVSAPSLEGRQVAGGIVLQPEYFALLVALVVYTSSHIAEIVRGSIQAVPRGQVEAASAMALSGSQRLRFIVLPQAMKVAIPPLGNQYLNLIKNSSLGFAISYFELTKVTSTAIGNRAPAVPAYVVLMVIYLVFSLVISGAINYFNHRMQAATR